MTSPLLTNLRTALALAVLFAAAAGAAEITIQPQSLATALQVFSEQSGLQVGFESQLAQGIQTRGTRGAKTPAEALGALLSGTGLEYRFVNDQTVVIREKSSQQTNAAAADLRWIQLASGAESVPPVAQSSAQDAASPSAKGIPEILVKGTRTLNMDIRRSRDDAQPYVIFEREKIERSGAPNLEGFLRDRLSMNTNGLSNGQRVNDRGSTSTFNLRGLGAGQTLILIDGHRSSAGLANGTIAAQTDLNTIPLSAVERIEVLPATASGIYGGGATGGVINVVLRRDYSGVETKAIYGNTFESDVANRRIELGAGTQLESGKTSLLFIGSYSDENPLTLQERPDLVSRYFSIVQSNAPALLLPLNNPPLGSRPNIRSFTGANLVLDAGLTPLNSPVTSIPAGYTGPGNASALLANAGRYDMGLADSIQNRGGGRQQIAQASESASFRSTLRRQFSSGVEGFLEASASRAKTAGPLTVANGGPTSPYRVAAAAPNNPFTTDILVSVPLGLGATTSTLTTDTLQRQLLGGAIVALPGGWRGEMDYTWARQRYLFGGASAGTTGAEVAAILNGTVDILRDTQLNPVNLSAYETFLPSAARQELRFRNATLRLSGPTVDLPGGPLGLSSLLEYRKESIDDSTQMASGFTFFYAGRDTSVKSVYLEAQFPLVSARNRRAGIEGFEVQLAARADEYRTLGGVTANSAAGPIPTTVPRFTNEVSSVNPTVAIRYQPIQDLALRASYGTGFVPPDASQLAPTVSAIPRTFNDPKRGGASTTLPVGAGLQGGNPNLNPEESDSLSVGAIFTPRIVPGLRLSLDYTRLEKTDNIAVYPTQVQGLINDENLWPGRVVRDSNPATFGTFGVGPVVFLDFTLFNVAKAEIEAFDLQLDYSLETRLGTFGLSSTATAQTHYKTQSLAGQPTFENVGVRYTGPQKYVGNAELKWQRADWSAGWITRYYHSYQTQSPEVVAATTTAALLLQGNDGIVPSQMYHDLYVTWRSGEGRTSSRLLDDIEVQLSLRNLFDKMPPFDAFVFNTFGYYHSHLGDPLGRAYRVSLAKRFR